MHEKLQKFGLDSKETAVYLALLEIGEPALASSIAKRTKLNRSTAYYILDQLVKKGLVVSSKGKRYSEFRAFPPSMLPRRLAEEGEKYIRLAEEANRLLPELNTHYREPSSRPRVYFHEGIDGLVRVYEETLSSSEEIRAYANMETKLETIPDYFPNYFKRRANKKIPVRALLVDNPKGRDLSSQDKNELRRSRLLPISKFNFTPEVNIFDNKIMIADWKEKLGVIIESEEIVRVFKQSFDLAWEAAEKYIKSK